MLKVGLTGGIASGKSTIAQFMKRESDFEVVQADQIAWQMYEPGTNVYQRLVERYGKKILDADGKINRETLGEILFFNEEDRKFINSLVHPAVQQKYADLAQIAEEENKKIFVVEAALYLESEPVDRSFFDIYVLVKVDPQIQLKRLMEQRSLSREAALTRISSQTPQDLKEKRADIVFENSGRLSELEEQACELINALRRLENESN